MKTLIMSSLQSSELWNCIFGNDQLLSKCMVPDEIHPRLLKELTDIIMGLFPIIFQQSWKSGEVPVNWRLANAVPYL